MTTKRKAFTLIEIMISAFILALIITIGYNLYTNFSRSFRKGSWSLEAQNSLRNALTFMREEMQKASNKYDVTFSGITIVSGHDMTVTTGNHTTNTDLIEWSINLPEISIGEIASQSEASTFKCKLSLKDGVIEYTKEYIEELGLGSPRGERVFKDYKIIENVASITLEINPLDPGGRVSSASLVVIEITLEHPDTVNFPSTFITSRTGAKIEIEVKTK